MRDRKRCGIEHACACAEQWQANQTKRPLPSKGDDDHVMICSTQSRGTQEARDSKEVSSTQSRGTQKVIDVRGVWYLTHALMRLSNVCPIE